MWAKIPDELPSSHDPPTNVTRIARAISRTCVDGTHQIISYHRGVGTGDTMLERVTGGAFGMGLDSVRIALSHRVPGCWHLPYRTSNA